MKRMAAAIVVIAVAANLALAQTGGTGITPAQQANVENEQLLQELRQIAD